MRHVINLQHVGAKGSYTYAIEQLGLIQYFAEENCAKDLQRKQFQEFLNETHQYDVILGEMFNTICYDGLARKIPAPFIGSFVTYLHFQINRK